jgi:hypothetical protein
MIVNTTCNEPESVVSRVFVLEVRDVGWECIMIARAKYERTTQNVFLDSYRL